MIAKSRLSDLVAGLLTLLASLEAKPLSVLSFRTDDMNHDSPSVCGGPIKDLTHNGPQPAMRETRIASQSFMP